MSGIRCYWPRPLWTRPGSRALAIWRHNSTSTGQTKGYNPVGRRLRRTWAAEGDVLALSEMYRAGGTRRACRTGVVGLRARAILRCRRRGGYVDNCSIACAVSPNSARRGVCATRWRVFLAVSAAAKLAGAHGAAAHSRVHSTAKPAAVRRSRVCLPHARRQCAMEAALVCEHPSHPVGVWTPTHSM